MINAERQELERVVGELGRDTRPGRLLAYVGERHFHKQEEKLTEFDIATQVFGRSPKNFDASDDAVVRVETHRLRKKLRDIYAKNPSPFGLQISLPAGTYVPTFNPAGEPPPAEELTPPRKSPTLLFAGGAIILIAAIITATFWVGSKPKTTRPTAGAPPTASGASPAPASATHDEVSELHLMSGYSGSEVIDNSGVRWTADRLFMGGGVWASDGHFVARTSRPFLFAKWRTGEFGYDIPVPPGVYELHLFFESMQRPGDVNLSTFGIYQGVKPLLINFDVGMDADGADVADEKVFRDITPDAHGRIRLRFLNEVGSPALNALELLPGSPHKQRPVRILAQPTSFVDHQGQRWRADDYFLNGFHSDGPRPVSGTEDPELFGGERFGHFSYAIPVDVRGRYTVILHFAEFYFGPSLPGGGGVGSRMFHVFCNGNRLLENFDVYKEGGSLRVVTKTFPHIEPSIFGKINLTFEPVVNNATVSGIEVIDESE